PCRVLQEMLAPVLTALDEQERGRVLLPDHAAVDPDVHHAGLRVARDDAREGVDIPPTLEVMPLRDRKLRLIDVLAPDHDVLDRARRDDPRRDRLAVGLHDVLDQLAIGDVLGKPEGQRQAPDAPEAAHEQPGAAPALVALDVLEQERGPLLLEHAARDGAQLAVPVDLGRDSPQLAFLVEPRDPLAQVDEAHLARAGATSVRKRLNWPTWSQEPKRSAMCPTPAAKYAESSSAHCLGPPAIVHCSTNSRENFAV